MASKGTNIQVYTRLVVKFRNLRLQPSYAVQATSNAHHLCLKLRGAPTSAAMRTDLTNRLSPFPDLAGQKYGKVVRRRQAPATVWQNCHKPQRNE